MSNIKTLLPAPHISKLLPQITDEQSYDFPEELIPQKLFDITNTETIHAFTKKMVNIMTEYRELMMMYNSAMKQIHTKFEILNAEYSVRYKRNPINFINTRLKSRSSIVDKMLRLNIPLTIENLESYIDDIAGIRVICSYVDDIYEITQAIIKQNDVTLISQKDYIAKPKPNGYRSMHLIISVPIFFTDQIKQIKVEIQIRTIAMDFWATLEHELKYKNQITHESKIAVELKECADIISDTDARMLEIRKKIVINEQTEEEILIEKIKKLDFPIG